MRESKRRRHQLRTQRNPQKRIVVEGKIGRCDMPSCGRVYPVAIMEREIERLNTKIRRRRKRGLTDEDPVVVNTPDMTDLYEEESVWTRHDNGMEAIAEACCTPDEVKAMVRPLMERALHKAMATHMPVRRARSMMWRAATKFLGEHYFVLPRKKVTIEKWSKHYLKGYQKWWHRVDQMRRQNVQRAEKTGNYGNPLADAIHRISPKIFGPNYKPKRG